MKTHLWRIGSYLLTVLSIFVSSGLITTTYAAVDPNDPGAAVADIIVDNRDANAVTYTGRWTASGVRGAYGTDSVWSRYGNTFTWNFTPTTTGDYEVFMWWTQYSTRTDAAEVKITDANGTWSVFINQQSNGAKWNSLGAFRFIGGTKYNVTIVATISDLLSTCADAIKVTFMGSAPPPQDSTPVAVIDSISPNPANAGTAITFTGHGVADKYPIVAYKWMDGTSIISETDSFISSSLSAGSHTITFTVKDSGENWSEPVAMPLTITEASTYAADIIIDNLDTSNISYTGRWTASGVKGWYGTNAVASTNGTFTWYFTPTVTADCNVSMWWTQNIARTNNAEVRITDATGTTSVFVNQQANGGKWNLLGNYRVNAGVKYNVTIIAVPNSASLSTCADAVKIGFKNSSPPPPAGPVAYIDSIIPNPALKGQSVVFTGHGTSASGQVVASQWTSSLDGNLSTLNSFSFSNLSVGRHTISYKVQDNLSRWSAAATLQLTINDSSSSDAEKIYVFRIFSWDYLFLKEMSNMLTRIGAKPETGSTVWHYTYAPTGKKFDIYYFETKEALQNALMEPGAHIVTGGHSNYGLGACFTLPSEGSSKKITAVRYANDDRFLNVCSDIVPVSAEGLVYGQIYPNWQPIFKDGTSALAPSSPEQGLPPYNYYISYRVPGDSKYYMVELDNGDNLKRFSDSSWPAWFSSTGAKPDPIRNPEYFAMYPFDDYSRCSFVGGIWTIANPVDDNEYAGYNYASRTAGTGTRKAVYNLFVMMPGQYELRAKWPARTDNASNAKYEVQHADGTSVITVSQRTSQSYGGSSNWNVLGTFRFNKGTYTVTLSDNANGRVIADAVELYPLSNPVNVVQAEFSMDKQSGSAPLTVRFTDNSLAMAGTRSRLWDFGDGTTSTSANPSHVYSDSGIYTVSLKVTDTRNASDTETKTSVIVAGNYSMVLDAKFTTATRKANGKLIAYFKNQTVGNATSYLWDFGDGSTSTLANPSHVYYLPGTHTVRLTASGPGATSTETEEDYIYVYATPVFADNTTKYKPMTVTTSMSPGSSGKIALNMAQYRMRPEDMKFKRLYWATCNSAPYFLDTFQHGIVFTTVTDIENYTAVQYVQNYMQDVNDTENLRRLNAIVNAHSMVNFNVKPSSAQ